MPYFFVVGPALVEPPNRKEMRNYHKDVLKRSIEAVVFLRQRWTKLQGAGSIGASKLDFDSKLFVGIDKSNIVSSQDKPRLSMLVPSSSANAGVCMKPLSQTH